MTLEQFNSLDLDKRTEAVWEWGFYVSRDKNERLNKVLYAIHGFFAEMVLSLENNQIIDVKGLAKPSNLSDDGYFIKNQSPFLKLLDKSQQ